MTWHWNKWPTQRFCGVWEGFKNKVAGLRSRGLVSDWNNSTSTRWTAVTFCKDLQCCVSSPHHHNSCKTNSSLSGSAVLYTWKSHDVWYLMQLWMTAILSGGRSSCLPSVSALYICTISPSPAALMTVVTATAHPSAVDGLIGLQMAIKVLLWP